MKIRFLAAAATLLAALRIFGSCTPATPREFTFVQITDPQMGFKEKGAVERSVRLLDTAVMAINAIHPAFVVVTGDLQSHWQDSLEYEVYKAGIAGISEDIPVYTVPGNHDYRPFKEPGSDVDYLEKYGTDRFAFTYGDCLFLGFNSSLVQDADKDPSKEEEQFEWIVSNLGKSGSKVSRRFLFAHCSIIRESVDEKEDYFNFHAPYREKYLKLCKDFGVDAVFTGHYHRPRNTTVEGTQHVTCTSSGWALGDGYPGINIVKVTKDGFSWEQLPSAVALKKAMDCFGK